MFLLLLIGKALFYLIIFVLAIILSVILYYKWSFRYWKSRKMCHIEPSIPFGNLLNPATKKISRMQEMEIIYKQLKSKGLRHAGIYQFAAPTYFVVDLELIRQILIKDFDHFTDRGMFYNPKHDPIGCHLVALGGEWWRAIRTKVSTCFTSTKLKEMFDLVLECTESFTQKIEELIAENQMPVDNKEISSCFTTDSVGSCMLGIKCRSFTDPEKNFIKYGSKVLELDRSGQARFVLGALFPNLARKIGVRQIVKEVSDFFCRVIGETVNSRRKNNVERNDVLQLLMKMNEDATNGITMNEVIANSFGLYIGGFETSSNSLNYFLFEMARNQHYQEKARQEVFNLIAKNNNTLTFEAMNDMKFLRQCLDETLRVYAPIHVINRVCTKDWKVPGEDVVVGKGTHVLISLTSINHDPEYWERPDEFYPEHHSEENKAKRHPFAFVPFGEGKRRCVGERFAKMQLIAAVATILKQYRMSVDEKTVYPFRYKPGSMVPVPIDGIWLRFERLNSSS